MNKQLSEFLDQIRECERIIQEEEDKKDQLYKRVDAILEAEDIDIISFGGK